MQHLGLCFDQAFSRKYIIKMANNAAETKLHYTYKTLFKI